MEQKRSGFDSFVRRPSLKVYMLAIVALILGGVFLKDHLSSPHIQGEEDLISIQGTVADWWYMEKTNGEKDLTFTVNEYKAGFTFHGKFFGFSYLQRFQSEVKKGGLVRMRISKYDFDKLKDEYAGIYPIGIWDDKNVYIEKDKALERELRPGDLYMALGSFGAALLFGSIAWLLDRKRRPAIS